MSLRIVPDDQCLAALGVFFVGSNQQPESELLTLVLSVSGKAEMFTAVRRENYNTRYIVTTSYV